MSLERLGTAERAPARDDARALCRSGRSPLAPPTTTRSACAWAGSRSDAADSMGARPPRAAASKDAVRTVPTIWSARSTSTVTMALPA